MTIPAFAHPRPPLPGLLDAAIVGLRECGLDSQERLLRAGVTAAYPPRNLRTVVLQCLDVVERVTIDHLHDAVALGRIGSVRFRWLTKLDQTRELLRLARDRLEGR